MLTLPEERTLTVWSQMPAEWRRPRPSSWAALNLPGREIGCFLEGPAFDANGNLYVVDIPFGRIFRIDPAGRWALFAEYDGWPNGLKVLPDGALHIADHKLGLIRMEPDGRWRVMLGALNGAPLLGLNDLTFGPDGAIYVTDQGQSGLHQPNGRLLRIKEDGGADVLLDNCPSPNGLVFAKDTSLLYVAMTRANAIWRVPLIAGQPSKVGLAIQMNGGIGPDGLALDRHGNLLAAQAPLGVWQFDHWNLPTRFYAAPDDEAYITNLATCLVAGRWRAYATDSTAGRIMVADLTVDRG
jgi:gluconolactonase